MGLWAPGSSPLARGTPPPHSLVELGGVRLIPARAGNTRRYRRCRRRYSAHPRSRGEHVLCFADEPRGGGSSPLARGTLFNSKARFSASRLIPARAGNTTCILCAKVSDSAHPRSRGEHLGDARGEMVHSGSSPLARGTPMPRGHHDSAGRLIPARAGNTWDTTPPAAASTAHPRSRGEHFARASLLAWLSGSSPLARGTLLVEGYLPAVHRLIPARAGNTITAFEEK